jgi:DNA primase
MSTIFGSSQFALDAFFEPEVLMSRIPDDELERLKREVSLAGLVEAHGVSLARHGKDLVGRCPFHDDTTPSLVISPDTNLWHCMGACNEGGSVIDWVMRAEGLAFRAAAEFLRQGGSPTVHLLDQAPAKHSRMLKQAQLCAGDADAASVWNAVVGHYHETLLSHAEARQYLASRGLDSDEAIRHFKLGYASRTLGYRLPPANRKDGAALRAKLQQLGIYRENGREHLIGSITVPLSWPPSPSKEHAGQMYGRRIAKFDARSSPEAAAGGGHMYTPGQRTAVWNADGLENDVILCESLLDALTFWVHGYRSVTAAYGVNGFTVHHIATFRARGVRTVRIAYDRDAAGEHAAAQLSEQLNVAGFETYRVLFPRGMDANEYASKLTPAKESLGLVVRKAEWLGKGAIAKMLAATESALAPSPSPATEERAEAPLKEESGEASTLGEARTTPVVQDQAGVVQGVVAEPISQPESALSPEAHEGRDELVFRFGSRTWRARGLSKNSSFSSLRVNLSVRMRAADPRGAPVSASVSASGFFVDTLDLYAARPRASFIAQVARELGLEEDVVKRDVGAVLMGLEEAQEARGWRLC